MKEQFSPVQVNIGSPSREGLYKGLSEPSFYSSFIVFKEYSQQSARELALNRCCRRSRRALL